MNSIKSLKNGVKAKNYGVKHFNSDELPHKRIEWMTNNPEVIIFNTHVIWDGKGWHHIFEYIKE